jgi:hypothetical protein
VTYRSEAPVLGEIAEHLPGEPAEPGLTGAALVAEVGGRMLLVVISALLMAPLWPAYLAARLVAERPPVVSPTARYARLLRLAARSTPELPASARLVAALILVQRWLWTPAWGLGWLLDELLYGRALDRVAVTAPIFELSAARSGSTQLAHYLEDDPDICAPNILQTLWPLRWAWWLAPRTLGRLWSAEDVCRRMEASMPPAFLQRHEMEPFRTDTFEVLFMHSQLGDLVWILGQDTYVEEFGTAEITPTNAVYWSDFVHFLDRVGRKTLLHTGRPRLMIKGHFLAVADELERRYPDARFLTVLRRPDKRLQSTICHHRYQPGASTLPPAPWAWLVARDLPLEITYCEREQAWFQREGGARRCVIRFQDFVRDLDGAVRRVYRDCLDRDEPPPHVPREHAPRKRTDYAVDRSLRQLGVDEAWLEQRLADYYRWCGVEVGQAAK